MEELLGIEIGGTKLQLVIGRAGARILERKRLAVARLEGASGIRREIERALGEWKGREFAGVGIGFGGPVDWRAGKAACSHQVEGWSGFELGDWLGRLTGAKVKMENDANTAALAEARLGSGRGKNPVFYVTLGSGVGGGLVVNGEIYHGGAPGEAEIGHVRLDREGTIVEERCSGWAVDRRIRAEAAVHPGSALTRLAGAAAGGEARHLAKALGEGDPLAQRILDETCEHLAFGLSHMVHLLNPEIIVLGGGLSLLGDWLSDRVRKHLPRFLMKAFGNGPEIMIAALGEDVVPAGALLLAESG